MSPKGEADTQREVCVHAQSLVAIPWTVAHQAPLSMGFSRQEYWNGLPFPPPGPCIGRGVEPPNQYIFFKLSRWLWWQQAWKPLITPHIFTSDKETEPDRGEELAHGHTAKSVAETKSVSGSAVSRTELLPAHPLGCFVAHDNLQQR